MSSIDLKGFIRPHLREIETFSPADPPELQAKKAGIAEEEIVRLNANENPYGFSPKVAEAVASVPYNIYPDPFQRKVRAALSEFTGVPAERIIAGAGSDEIIDLIFRLVIEPGDKIIDSEPTFGMYSFDARVNGAETVMVQRDENFDVDVKAVKDAIDERAKIIFLCSPNNPTGNVATLEQIEGLVETGLLVVIDEAYWEFSGSTAASMVERSRQPDRPADDEQMGRHCGTSHRLRHHVADASQSHHRHQAAVQRHDRIGGGAHGDPR